MNPFAVGLVGDFAAREPRFVGRQRDARQEALEPTDELALRYEPLHEVGFHQRRRQEILAGRLVGERRREIVEVKLERLAAHRAFELRVLERGRGVE